MYPGLSNLSSQLASVHLNPANHNHNSNQNPKQSQNLSEPQASPSGNPGNDPGDQMYTDSPYSESMDSSFGSSSMSDFTANQGQPGPRRYISGLSNALTQEKGQQSPFQEQHQRPQQQQQSQFNPGVPSHFGVETNDGNASGSDSTLNRVNYQGNTSLTSGSASSLINNNANSNASTSLGTTNESGMNNRPYNAPRVTVPIKKDYRQLLQPIARMETEENGVVVDRVALYRDNCPDHGITLFSHRSAPNGFKVAVILSELNLNYRTFYLDFNLSEQRSPSYTQMNPNGRVPTLVDHDNNDHIVWESGAMIIYLCQKAGPDCPLYSDDPLEQSQILSWIFFQTSGHAPMLGQALHFKYFHPETVPSAISRYESEVRRIYSVLEMALAVKREQLIYEMDDETFRLGTTPLSQSRYFDEPVWLVSNRCTIADLSFVTWNSVVDKIGIDLRSEFPEVWKWTGWMMTRENVRRALEGHDND
ncbi:glutathione S-transferase [Nadsonia fulvescens var. elongata DSM 6958]|uniref:Glutathione S-transferase n=1 Tax=Nadsonia fulvescens var. elongata DSM 6958 TaxID=857566 RepID=A0A1E3PHZ9_9ASCO|nr:glutathione S-transferase [Nadsonia fulvescens var. elongata DSM 6958]